MSGLALLAEGSSGIMSTKLGWADVRIDVDGRYAEWRSSLNAYYQTLGGDGPKVKAVPHYREQNRLLSGAPPQIGSRGCAVLAERRGGRT